MEKSIETIWKEGFLKNNALIAPKINDLYNQKSQHVIEKFKRLAKANLIGIVIGAGIILIFSFIAGVPIVGLLIASILMWSVVVGVRQSKVLNQISTNRTSYQYLKEFDHWLQETIRAYEKLYRWAYSMFFMLFAIGALYGNINSDDVSIIDHITTSSELTMIYGVPVVVIVVLASIALITSVLSSKLYKLDLDLMYGQVFRKIKELLHDMEDLTTTEDEGSTSLARN